MHGEPAKEPTPSLVKLTVPVGVVGPIKPVSLTVTVHMDVWFIATEEGEQVIAVAVESLPKLIDADP